MGDGVYRRSESPQRSHTAHAVVRRLRFDCIPPAARSVFPEKYDSLSHTNPRKIWWLIILSLALAALANLFIFSSIKILGASTASIFEISYPFFVVLFTFLIYGAEFNLYFLIGAVLIFAGSAMIISTT